MKGRSSFSEGEASRIRLLLGEKMGQPRYEQKRIRSNIRALGFFISDFRESTRAFTAADFDSLVIEGRVTVGSP